MNQTIYFRKDIWEQFKDEPEKSALVNGLLEAHYGVSTKAQIEDIVKAQVPGIKSKWARDSVPLKPMEINLGLANERLDQGLCKIHGLPLDSRGRCMQKGCKYS